MPQGIAWPLGLVYSPCGKPFASLALASRLLERLGYANSTGATVLNWRETFHLPGAMPMPLGSYLSSRKHMWRLELTY